MTAALATTEISPMLQRAHEQCAALLDAETQVTDALENLCTRLWDLGKSLSELKEVVGHGKWVLYVVSNFPELGKEEKTRHNRSIDAINFFASNPKYPDTGVFTVESVRKCVFHLAPEKERPELPGDAPIAPHAHPLTFVNHFIKWDRQAALGMVIRPPVDVMRRDLEPVVKRIAELAGPDWMRSVVEVGA